MDLKWINRVKHLSIQGQWETLYNDKKKVQEDGKSIWGKGNVYRNSKKLVDLLPGVLEELGIKTFTDIGCGDFLWLSQLDWSKIDYHGYDIVRPLIKENRKNYSGFKFDVLDLIEDECPKSDMIFVRSVFIHTCLQGCLRMIENIKASGSKYLMASTLPYIEENHNTKCLWLVKRNLQIEPFNFPEPLYLIPEMDRDDRPNNFMGVWKIEDLS
ncbi:MAG: hypothetical protein JSW06_02720 [Thermoplasmatales archaeon]|nr:MAG: hypothetical protein JSW06_02720 [Thermoplasmatales archaeon]